MASISICVQSQCPLAPCCYRYNANPTPVTQSYAAFEYKVNGQAVECDYYEPFYNATEKTMFYHKEVIKDDNKS